MDAGLRVMINGQERRFADLTEPAGLDALVEALGLKADRVAVELNGEIAPRAQWSERAVKSGDKVEVVHFVGGGSTGWEWRAITQSSRRSEFA